MLLEQIVNAITLGSVFALFAIGLSLAWGSLDVLNLAHGSFFAAGAWAAYELASNVAAPFVVLVVLGMAVGAVVAVLLEFVAFRPIRQRIHNKRQAELSTLAATVGMGIIADQVISHATGNQVFSIGSATFTIQAYHVFGVQVTNIQIIIVATSLVVAWALSLWVAKTRHGIAVRAIAFSPPIPAMYGVNVARVAAATMAVSGALAGLAGVLLCVWVSGMDVSTGHSFLLKGFAIVVVGGVGSIKGGVLAAFILAFAETGVAAYGPGGLRDAVAFVLIILILLVRPQGIFGRQRAVRT
jgi:branched-chain amino acid transport system permease protein